MKLTREEVEIMTQVRDKMQARYDAGTLPSRPYICWTILEVVTGKDCMFSGVSLEGQFTELGGDAERLFRKINWALGGIAGRLPQAMDGFISSQLYHFGPKFVKFANHFKAEARLAWLDRIVEMEEIK